MTAAARRLRGKFPAIAASFLAPAPAFGYIPVRAFFNLMGSKMLGTRSGIVILTALLLSGSAAMAQSGNPCGADIKKLCPDIKAGDGRITACMKSHLTELSENCEVRVLGVAVNGKACKADATKLCSGIAPGTGGVRTCMKSHMAEVSDSCKDAMAVDAAGKKLFGHGTN
jgi:hypothetical protein